MSNHCPDGDGLQLTNNYKVQKAAEEYVDRSPLTGAHFSVEGGMDAFLAGVAFAREHVNTGHSQRAQAYFAKHENEKPSNGKIET